MSDQFFEDDSFDLVIAINTVHNLEGKDLERSQNEISRVSKRIATLQLMLTEILRKK